MSASVAASPPIHGDRAIWDVVVHLTQWIRDTRRWLLHGPPEPNWDAPWARRSAEPSEAAETAWQAAIDDLMAAHDEFVSTLREIPTARLKVPLNTAGPGTTVAPSAAGICCARFTCTSG